LNYSKLQSIGWSNYFLQQLSFDEISSFNQHHNVFRISAIHRNSIESLGEEGQQTLMCPTAFQPVSQFLAVGDWVVAKRNHEHFQITKIIPPKNRIERLTGNVNQVIAANLDYLWIVTSANKDFNLKRLQRYLALAHEFEIEPVIILTKTDLCENNDTTEDNPSKDTYWYLQQISQLKVSHVHGVNMSDTATLKALDRYYQTGNTIALVGSSGVGKSTLINVISNAGQNTQEIRKDDAKGKHTTTHRQLFFCKNQVAFIDTPGMRELKLPKTELGLERTFADIIELAGSCKFANCNHMNEPGCAIQNGLKQGYITQSDFSNFKRRELGSHAQKQHTRSYFKQIKSSNKESW
jgi:ribosome biogenesis GTPase